MTHQFLWPLLVNTKQICWLFLTLPIYTNNILSCKFPVKWKLILYPICKGNRSDQYKFCKSKRKVTWRWTLASNLTADHLVFLLQIVYSRVITGQTFIPFLHLIENTCSDVSQSGSVWIGIYRYQKPQHRGTDAFKTTIRMAGRENI